MADTATLDEFRNQLKEEWRKSTDQTEEEVKNLIPDGEMSKEESQNVSNQAKEKEAKNRSNAIVDTVISGLLDKVEALEGKIEELKSSSGSEE